MEPYIEERLPFNVPVNLLQYKVVASGTHALHCATNVWCDEDARRLHIAKDCAKSRGGTPRLCVDVQDITAMALALVFNEDK